MVKKIMLVMGVLTLVVVIGVVTVGGKVWPVGEGVLFVPEPA